MTDVLPGGPSTTPRRKRVTVWLSVILVTIGMLFGVVVGLNLVAIALKLTHHAVSAGHPRSPQSTVMLFATGSVLGELLALLVLWRILRGRGVSLKHLGLWKSAPAFGWIAGVLVACYSVIPEVLGLHSGALHLAFSQILFHATAFHIYTALVLGCGAGLCEEVFFRGFVMTQLSDAGYGQIVQVVASALLFGVAHGLYAINNNLQTGLDVMFHTAVLGGLYAIVYLISRRSLMPCILSHALNDGIVLPWIFLQMFHPR